MKYLLYFLTIISLALPSCSTPGGKADTGAIVNIAVGYGAARHLASAKTLESFQSKQGELAMLAAVLKAANGEGLDPATLRAIIGQKFGNKPEVLLLANLVLAYYHPAAGAPKNELLSQAVAILEAASTQPPPVF